VSHPGWPIDDHYRVDLFAQQDAISAEDVLELWASEGVLSGDEGLRRVPEILLVASGPAGELVGVSTAYLRRDERLRTVLWHQRSFVAGVHRQSLVGIWLGLAGRDHLQERFVSGADLTAGGLLWEVENEGLKRTFPQALWLPTDFPFVGVNARGDHVRVHWFPGAIAPGPED
jgi:hypothetical protein